MILDSNILIYVVDPAYERLREYIESLNGRLHISLITQLEVLGYHRLREDNKQELEQLLTFTLILPITKKIITEAIRLRQQRKRSLGDSIIAATGLLYNLPILTNNVADFNDIDGLRVIALSQIV